MLVIVIVALIALAMIYIEFFVPGGVVGGIGGLGLIGSFIVLAFKVQHPIWIGLAAVVYIAALVAVISLALHFIKKSGSNLYLSKDQEGYSAATIDRELIGKRGIAFSNLSLSGRVTIDGKNYQAISQSQYIGKGEEIEVIDGRGAYLVVKQVKGDN